MESLSQSHEYMFKDGNRRNANRKLWICGIVAVIAGFIIGILIGRFATCPEEEKETKPEGIFLPGVPESIIQDGDPSISDEIISSIKAENIREYLR